MKCSKCGTELQPNYKFCTKCGTPINSPVSENQSEKGLIDNITHFGTFIQRGTQGVQNEIRNEQRARLEQEARNLGMEVVKPSRSGILPNATLNTDNMNGQPRERRISVDSESVEGVEIVNGRAIWNIQKGQVARLITEAEFANTDNLKGVIVQEGCTAIIYVDGEMVSLMQSGVYSFPVKSVFEKKLEEQQKDLEREWKELDSQAEALNKEVQQKADEYSRTFRARGVFGEIAAFGRGIMNFLFGEKKGEDKATRTRRIEHTAQKLKLNVAPKICRVYLVSNRMLNLLFDVRGTSSGDCEFVPMVIPTKILDLKVAVTAQLQITNVNVFVRNYLVDKKSVSLLDIQQLLLPAVKTTLTQTLRNFNYQENGLPDEIISILKGKLQTACNERITGMEVNNILDITDRNDDFSRFREVERELFASEKELDFLQRTGEFRNRLEQENNRQAVNKASNEEQLRQAIQAINKDKLLSEDEMAQFVFLLQSEKRIREAKTREEEYEALGDLRKSGLVMDDEIAALQLSLEQGRISRENVRDLLRVQTEQKLNLSRQIAAFELSDNQLQHDIANEMRLARHKGDLMAAELEAKRMEDSYLEEKRRRDDDYQFARMQRNDDFEFQKKQREQALREQQNQMDYSRVRQDREDELSALERRAALARQNMQAMKDAELRELQEKNRSAENLSTIQANVQMNRDNNFMQMNADQIRAAQLSHLDKEAQVAMAQSYSSEKENELRAAQQQEQKALYEQMLQQQNLQSAQMQQQMLQMAQMMQQGMMGVSQNQMDMQRQQFMQQQQMQQQRYDDQVAMKNEYRDNAAYQQQRMDHVQDQALGTVGRVSSAAANNINAFNGGGMNAQPQNATAKYCPECGSVVSQDELFCPDCGCKL